MKQEKTVIKIWEYCNIWDKETEIHYIIFKQDLSNNNHRMRIYKKEWLEDIVATINMYGDPNSMLHDDTISDWKDILFDFLINSGKNITEEEIKQKDPNFKWKTIEIVEPETFSCGYFWMKTKIDDKDVTLVREATNDYSKFNIKIFDFTFNDFTEYEDFSKAIVEKFEENPNVILEKDIKCYQEWNTNY